MSKVSVKMINAIMKTIWGTEGKYKIKKKSSGYIIEGKVTERINLDRSNYISIIGYIYLIIQGFKYIDNSFIFGTFSSNGLSSVAYVNGNNGITELIYNDGDFCNVVKKKILVDKLGLYSKKLSETISEILKLAMVSDRR